MRRRHHHSHQHADHDVGGNLGDRPSRGQPSSRIRRKRSALRREELDTPRSRRWSVEQRIRPRTKPADEEEQSTTPALADRIEAVVKKLICRWTKRPATRHSDGWGWPRKRAARAVPPRVEGQGIWRTAETIQTISSTERIVSAMLSGLEKRFSHQADRAGPSVSGRRSGANALCGRNAGPLINFAFSGGGGLLIFRPAPAAVVEVLQRRGDGLNREIDPCDDDHLRTAGPVWFSTVAGKI